MRTSSHLLCAAAAALGAAFAPGLHAASVALSGPDGTGTLSLSGLKNWTPTFVDGNPDPVNPPASLTGANGLPDFAYFYNPDFQRADGGFGVWQSLVAVPLSAGTTYKEEATYTVLNKTVTQPNFSAFSAGNLNYDASGLTGTGTEVIAASAVSFTFNNEGFSPSKYKGQSADFPNYDDGSGFGNAGYRYTITANNLAGTGLTFIDGVLRSIDLTANIDVTGAFSNLAWTTNFGWTVGPGSPSTSNPLAVFSGTLAMSGNTYAFDLDATRDIYTALTGSSAVEDVRLVLNRSGTIAGVTPIPEPGTWAMLALGLAAVGAAARRRAA
jgi:hypothetical protein